MLQDGTSPTKPGSPFGKVVAVAGWPETLVKLNVAPRQNCSAAGFALLTTSVTL